MIDESVKAKIYELEEAATKDYNDSPFSDEYLEGYRDGLHQAAKELSTAPTVDAVPVDAIETYIAMLKEAECTQSAMVIENMLKEIGIEPKSERPKSDRSDTKDAMEQEGERWTITKNTL